MSKSLGNGVDPSTVIDGGKNKKVCLAVVYWYEHLYGLTNFCMCRRSRRTVLTPCGCGLLQWTTPEVMCTRHSRCL